MTSDLNTISMAIIFMGLFLAFFDFVRGLENRIEKIENRIIRIEIEAKKNNKKEHNQSLERTTNT